MSAKYVRSIERATVSDEVFQFMCIRRRCDSFCQAPFAIYGYICKCMTEKCPMKGRNVIYDTPQGNKCPSCEVKYNTKNCKKDSHATLYDKYQCHPPRQPGDGVSETMALLLATPALGSEINTTIPAERKRKKHNGIIYHVDVLKRLLEEEAQSRNNPLSKTQKKESTKPGSQRDTGKKRKNVEKAVEKPLKKKKGSDDPPRDDDFSRFADELYADFDNKKQPESAQPESESESESEPEHDPPRDDDYSRFAAELYADLDNKKQPESAQLVSDSKSVPAQSESEPESESESEPEQPVPAQPVPAQPESKAGSVAFVRTETDLDDPKNARANFIWYKVIQTGEMTSMMFGLSDDIEHKRLVIQRLKNGQEAYSESSDPDSD